MSPTASHEEEVANALSHGLGVVLSLVGGAVLLTMSALRGSTIQFVAAAVFVFGLVLLYSASSARAWSCCTSRPRSTTRRATP